MLRRPIINLLLYLISRTNVHFVGQGDGRPHLGGQTVKDSKNVKKDLLNLRRF